MLPNNPYDNVFAIVFTSKFRPSLLLLFFQEKSLNILKLSQFFTILLQVPFSHVLLYNLVQLHTNFKRDLIPTFLFHCITVLLFMVLFHPGGCYIWPTNVAGLHTD